MQIAAIDVVTARCPRPKGACGMYFLKQAYVNTQAYGTVMKNSHSSIGSPRQPTPVRWASLNPQTPSCVNQTSQAMKPVIVSKHAGQNAPHSFTNATRLSKLATKGTDNTARFTHK